MCVSGAREVQKGILEKIQSDKLRVLVVWTPVLPWDNRDKALAATKLIPDKRTTHCWDKARRLGKEYGKALKLPGGGTFAWDIYLLFDAPALWNETPPAPTNWMHQLGQDSRRLDVNKLRQEVSRLLQVAAASP
jgi:hypothetical protein